MLRRYTARAEPLNAPMSRPSTLTVPLSTTSIAPATWSSVDLPDPERPVTATVAPVGMSTDTSAKASTGSPAPDRYVLLTDSKRTARSTDVSLFIGGEHGRKRPVRGEQQDGSGAGERDKRSPCSGRRSPRDDGPGQAERDSRSNQTDGAATDGTN